MRKIRWSIQQWDSRWMNNVVKRGSLSREYSMTNLENRKSRDIAYHKKCTFKIYKMISIKPWWLKDGDILATTVFPADKMLASERFHPKITYGIFHMITPIMWSLEGNLSDTNVLLARKTVNAKMSPSCSHQGFNMDYIIWSKLLPYNFS